MGEPGLHNRSIFAKVYARWKSDFQFFVISLLGVFVILTMAPFAVFRFLNGDIAVFLMEIGIIVFSTATVVYAYVSGNTALASAIMATSITAGIVFTGKPSGVAAFYWFFTAIVFNFSLMKPKFGLVITLLGLLGILIFNDIFNTPSEKMIFVTAVLATTSFNYILAYRIQSQQNQLRIVARTDPLTKVKNRRAYDEELFIALSDHKRTHKTYTIIAFDIDHFKMINDNYGHEKGDEALVALVDVVKAHTRPMDRLFRIGGEEFCLLLESLHGEKQLKVAEKIRKTVESNKLIEEQQITISIGVANVNESDDIKSWGRRADEALYEAKKSGRNRCVVSETNNEVAAV